MSYWEKINTVTKEGFEIVFSVAYEDLPLDELFDDVEEVNQLCKQIDKGELQYFVARIQAYKKGIKLGDSYLGGNLYESYNDFIGDSMYDDLVYQAIEEAKNNIKELLNDLN